MKKIVWISFFVFLLDMVSKRIMLHFLSDEKSVVVIKNFFSFTLAKNTGVAFSMLEGEGLFIIFGTILVLVFLIQYVKKHSLSFVESLAYAFIIGGSIGNLIDRIIYGYVIDFLDFKIFSWDFPIFNFADCFIVIGVCLIFIIAFREGGKKI